MGAPPHPAARDPETRPDRWGLLSRSHLVTNLLLNRTLARASGVLAIGALLLASGVAAAQSLPVSVTASGNHAEVVIGMPTNPLAEMSLDFQDATGLSPASLGVSAQQVSLADPALLARLPDVNLTTLTSALPLLITVEPPTAGGLSFRNTGRLEIHTHALAYSVGSSYRVLKAPLGGPFRDVTDEIAQGSVRARTTYGGFSQFLIVTDLRTSATVIDEKIGWLRGKVAALPQSERGALNAFLDQADSAVDAGDFTTAIAAVDAFRSRVQARAGQFIPNEWRATHDVDNQAGDLVAGANTLRFSIAYLRDFGQ
jgi:uncharacterized protein DUF6689